MARLVVRPAAAREFVARARYFAREVSPATAARFQKALADSLDRLARRPGIGSPWESDRAALAGIRVWPVRRFRKLLIFYRVSDDTLEILHLLHAAQDIERWLEGSD